uniref:uncharacterized protein n=1 Tax=Myxine glutinosa TaxID=7769 RepID=UPI00358F6A7D
MEKCQVVLLFALSLLRIATTVRQKEITVKSGATLTLECRIRYPHRHNKNSIGWNFNENDIRMVKGEWNATAHKEARMVFSLNLIIRNISTKDEGHYFCQNNGIEIEDIFVRVTASDLSPIVFGYIAVGAAIFFLLVIICIVIVKKQKRRRHLDQGQDSDTRDIITTCSEPETPIKTMTSRVYSSALGHQYSSSSTLHLPPATRVHSQNSPFRSSTNHHAGFTPTKTPCFRCSPNTPIRSSVSCQRDPSVTLIPRQNNPFDRSGTGRATYSSPSAAKHQATTCHCLPIQPHQLPGYFVSHPGYMRPFTLSAIVDRVDVPPDVGARCFRTASHYIKRDTQENNWPRGRQFSQSCRHQSDLANKQLRTERSTFYEPMKSLDLRPKEVKQCEKQPIKVKFQETTEVRDRHSEGIEWSGAQQNRARRMHDFTHSSRQIDRMIIDEEIQDNRPKQKSVGHVRNTHEIEVNQKQPQMMNDFQFTRKGKESLC